MLNLIFDLDNTLIHSENIQEEETTFIRNIKGVDIFYIKVYDWVRKRKTNKKRKKKRKTKRKLRGKDSIWLIFQRKNLGIFLRFCFKYFNVGFWSNGRIDYVKGILKGILLPDEFKKSICMIGKTKIENGFIYYKDITNKKKFKIKETNDKYSKKLEYIYNNNIRKNNTLLFDDGLFNKGVNCSNTILIPKYRYYTINDKCLFKLIQILDKIKKYQTIDKININLIEEEIFKNYKLNDKIVKKKKKYKKGDTILVKDNKIKAINNDIVIKKVNKNNYEVMYVSKKNNELATKKINNEDILWELLIN